MKKTFVAWDYNPKREFQHVLVDSYYHQVWGKIRRGYDMDNHVYYLAMTPTRGTQHFHALKPARKHVEHECKKVMEFMSQKVK